jgi:hypothetical protein
MKNFLLFFTLLAFMKADGQALRQFNLNIGQQFSSFKYQDAGGNKDTNLTFRKGAFYSIGLGFDLGKRHQIRPEIYFTASGANSKFVDIPVEYNLNYLGINAGYLYKIISKERFAVNTGIGLSFDRLLEATQSVGFVEYDLLEEKLLKPWDYHISWSALGRFMITPSMFLNLEYRYRYGLIQIENSGEGENAHNIGHLAIIGLSFELFDKKQ